MDSIEEALLAIFIGTVVAEFLRKTSRVLQAIEVFKECLIKLHSQVLAGNFTNQQSKHYENDRKHKRPGTMLQKPWNNVAIA